MIGSSIEEDLVVDPTCEDKKSQCKFWSEGGECREKLIVVV
jgi:hypothetical protein